MVWWIGAPPGRPPLKRIVVAGAADVLLSAITLALLARRAAPRLLLLPPPDLRVLPGTAVMRADRARNSSVSQDHIFPVWFRVADTHIDLARWRGEHEMRLHTQPSSSTEAMQLERPRTTVSH